MLIGGGPVNAVVMSAQPAGFWESKLTEDAGCLADLVADVDCGKIQITANTG
jgi:hypothetical protein